MKRNLIFGIVYLFVNSMFAQQDPIVMRINGKDIYRSEFEYSYRQDCTGAIKPTLKNYTELFIDYKLKIAEAEAIGLDTSYVFREQLQKYRQNLSRLYLIDEQKVDSCTLSFYSKTKTAPYQVQVMQIFRRLPQNITSSLLNVEKVRMDSIYLALKKQPDIDFSQWVNLFSDDKETKWIENLRTTSEFENIAFSLPVGEYSSPFYTPEGIHILKVTGRKNSPTYEQLKDTLNDQLAFFLRNKGEADRALEQLKRHYNYVPNQAGIQELLEKSETDKILFTFAGQSYTGTMFKRFAQSTSQSIKKQFAAYVMKTLLDYEYEKLEYKYPAFHNSLQAYKDKQLFAAITYKKLDFPVLTDSIGLSLYFKYHKSDYNWEYPKYKGALLHCADKRTAKQAKKLLKKAPEVKWADIIQNTFNMQGVERVKMEQEVFAEGNNKYIDKLVFKRGSFEPLKSYPFTIVVGEKQKGPDSYKEVLDEVKKAYRKYLDTCWVKQLRNSCKVEINQEVLKTVNNH